MKRSIVKLDDSITRAIRSWPDSLEPLMIGLSYLGLPAVVITASIILSIVAYVQHRWRLAITFGLVGIAIGFNTIIKNILGRARPDTLYVGQMKFKSYSFPSGHTLGATVFYGLLAYLAYKTLPAPWNIVVTGALIILIILIGLSRIYLGAHYPTDVIGGWVLGGIMLATMVIVLRPLK